MTSILNGLEFALRRLRKSPGFALTAVLTLALGIGANAAMFTVVDSVLIRGLPHWPPRFQRDGLRWSSRCRLCEANSAEGLPRWGGSHY